MRPEPRCPVCASDAVSEFFVLEDVPVHCNILWPDPREARRAPRGDVRLGVCAECGMIHNFAFDPSLVTYRAEYENALHFSPRFRAYAERLVERLANRYALEGATVVEIGCGDGDFLSLLAGRVGATGVGFDPSYDGPEGEGDVRVVRRPYTEADADLEPGLICCRHTLEHVDDPRGFLSGIARAARGGTPVYFEVPNARWMLRERGVWDVIYEHPSYFSPATLRHLFELSGFEVSEVSTAFGDQYARVDGSVAGVIRPSVAGADEDEVREMEGAAAEFAEAHHLAVEAWADRLAGWFERGRSVALWGAGSKGVSFLNTVPGGGRIAVVVDVNPRKAGQYVPGTGQRIVPPETLLEASPDVVVVMNPIYESEIRTALERLGVEAEVVTAEAGSWARA